MPRQPARKSSQNGTTQPASTGFGKIQDILNPDITLHHQIYMQLKDEITDGLWVGRNDFPGEEDLADQYGVSAITARKALTRLSHEGLISRARGRKTTVLYLPSSKPVARSSSSNPIGKTKRFAYRILSVGIEVGAAEACAAFGMKAGSQLWTCRRLRVFQGRPHSVSFHSQPIEVGQLHNLDKLRLLPMYQALTESGVKISGITRTAEARFPPPFVARHLGIVINDPTLVFTYIFLTKDGQKVSWARIFLHPDEQSPKEYINYDTGTWTSDDVR